MHEGIKPIKYHPGLFDKYKNIDNLDEWKDFPELMWGLGFEMDSFESFPFKKDFDKLKLKEPKSNREEKRNFLYILEHESLQVVGNYLFSHWRYLTHWAYFYDNYDIDFLKRVIKILEDKYDNNTI